MVCNENWKPCVGLKWWLINTHDCSQIYKDLLEIKQKFKFLLLFQILPDAAMQVILKKQIIQ